MTHGCPAQFMLERAHGIDSTRFQVFPRHLDTKGSKAVPHQTIVLHELMKYFPWGNHDRLVGEHGGDDPRGLAPKRISSPCSMDNSAPPKACAR